MNHRIEIIEPKKLIGMRMQLSLAQYTVGDLWRKFMPRRNELSNSINLNVISMAIYPPNYFSSSNEQALFERWASIEVSSFENVPTEMETYTLPGGQYAVFTYKGLNTNRSVFQEIYSTWLPQSGYELDDRPHFEILGEAYRNNDPNSEEEIWIPVKSKR